MERFQFVVENRIVFEWKFFGFRFQKEIERIQHRHFRDQVHFHQKLTSLFRKNQAREIVGLRVLLPVNEMLFGRNAQRVAQNARARMRCRAQANDLWTQRNGPVVFVMCFMMEGNVDRHGYFGF